MLDLAIKWNVSPEAFSLGPVTVRWYGILFGCAFIMCYYAFKELLKYNKVPNDFADRALMYMILGTIIGARVGDCFFYHPEHYLKNPLELFAVWKGGLSSHGGACGILISLLIFSYNLKKPYIWVLDRVVIVIGVAGFFIRTGNLMNSEIYGYATSLPWGFIYERNGEIEAKHPTQIYEALYYAFTYLVLRFVYRKCDNNPRPFLIFGIFLVMVFGFRFCIEFIKNPQIPIEEEMLLNMGQLLSLPFLILGFIMLFISTQQKKPEPEPLLENVQQPVNVHKPKPLPHNSNNVNKQQQSNKQQQKKKKK